MLMADTLAQVAPSRGSGANGVTPSTRRTHLLSAKGLFGIRNIGHPGIGRVLKDKFDKQFGGVWAVTDQGNGRSN